MITTLGWMVMLCAVLVVALVAAVIYIFILRGEVKEYEDNSRRYGDLLDVTQNRVSELRSERHALEQAVERLKREEGLRQDAQRLEEQKAKFAAEQVAAQQQALLELWQNRKIDRRKIPVLE